MTGRPIASPASYEAYELVKKAQTLLDRAEEIEKAMDKKMGLCPDCGEKKMDMEKNMCMKMGCGTMQKADMAGKDKYCMKNFGKKYSECSGEQKAQCNKSVDKVEKGEHHKIQTFNTNPESTQFMIETGGQTYNQFYSTNQNLLDSEDIANKGALQSSVNIEALNKNQNPHDTPASGHLTEG